MRFASFLLISVCYAQPHGVTNPAVTQENLSRTVCQSGWSKAARPPSLYTGAIKFKLLAERGDLNASMTDDMLKAKAKSFELDHWIPIEDGGHPTDPANLWLQPWPEAKRKDRVENWIHRQLCAGHIDLVDVAPLIVRWEAIYAALVAKDDVLIQGIIERAKRERQ